MIRSLLLSFFLLSGLAVADDASRFDEKILFDIPQLKADLALLKFAEQADVTFVYPLDKVQEIDANAVRGYLTRSKAMEKLLLNTGIEMEFTADRAITVRSINTQSVSDRGKKMNKRGLLAGFIAALTGTAGLSTGTEAQAQSAANRGIEEVVVTAQKREESMQDIPLAVSALGTSALEQSGFDGVEDLSYMVPSLQFGNFGPVAFLNIRGIGSSDPFAGSDPGVAMHVDGVYIGRPVGSIFNAFDTERVEVLRGPQGTLYGRNATGGSVNLITKKPDDEFAGEFEGTIGNYNLRRVRGMLNIPLSDTVSARVVAFNEDRDGFTANTFPGGTEANDLDNYGIRAHLNFSLSDTGSLLLSATHIDIGGVGSQPEQRDAISTGELNPPINALVAGPLPVLSPGIPANLAFYTNTDGSIPVNDLRPFVEGKNDPESTSNQFTLISATLDLDFDNFSIKSITGYSDSEYLTIQDNDATTAPNYLHIPEEQADQFSQEIQIISNSDSALRWIGGLYYFKEDATRITTLDGARPQALLDLFLTNDFSLGGPGFNEEYVFRVGGDVETTSYAIFGQGTYDFSDQLAVTLGLRYTDDEKVGTNRNIQFAPLVVTQALTESQEVTGKLAVDYKLNDDILLYGSFSRGYKSGGIIQVTTDPTAAAFNPEFVDTIEFGYKSQLWDVLQLNAAIYSSDYTDLQTSAFGAAGPLGGNAGAASIEGFELEWKWLIGENWSFDGSFSRTDGVYDELLALDPLDQFQSGGLVDYSGNDLPRTPDTSYNLGITGEWDLTDRGYLKARLEGSYTDEVFYEFTNRPEVKLGDYTNVNFRMMWNSTDDKYNAEFYVTNLTDQVQEGNLLLAFGFGASTLPNGFLEPGQEFVTYNAPRQVGLKVGYSF